MTRISKAQREELLLPRVKALRVPLKNLLVNSEARAEFDFLRNAEYWRHFYLGRVDVFYLALEMLDKTPVTEKYVMDNLQLQMAYLEEINDTLVAFVDQSRHDADMVGGGLVNGVARGVASGAAAVFGLLGGRVQA